MKKILIFVLITLFMESFSAALFSQTEKNIGLLDLANNKSTNVNIKEDWGSQNIILISQNQDILDTIKVHNVQEIDSIYVVMEKFLIISYKFNGGSGEHLRNTKLFTIKDGILFESLSLLTMHESFSSDGILQKGYYVNFNINKYKNNYTIFLVEKEKRNQKSIFNKGFKLLWDIKYMVFYSSVVKKNRIICINNKSVKTNNIFRIDLRKESYIYYRKEWYQQGRKYPMTRWLRM